LVCQDESLSCTHQTGCAKALRRACSLIGGLRPGSPTFSESNQRDVQKRGKGPTQDARINIVDQPKKFLGITRFGFSKQNEVCPRHSVRAQNAWHTSMQGRVKCAIACFIGHRVNEVHCVLIASTDLNKGSIAGDCVQNRSAGSLGSSDWGKAWLLGHRVNDVQYVLIASTDPTKGSIAGVCGQNCSAGFLGSSDWGEGDRGAGHSLASGIGDRWVSLFLSPSFTCVTFLSAFLFLRTSTPSLLSFCLQASL